MNSIRILEIRWRSEAASGNIGDGGLPRGAWEMQQGRRSTGVHGEPRCDDVARGRKWRDGGHVGSSWVRNVKDGVCLRGSRHTRSALAYAEATATAMAGG